MIHLDHCQFSAQTIYFRSFHISTTIPGMHTISDSLNLLCLAVKSLQNMTSCTLPSDPSPFESIHPNSRIFTSTASSSDHHVLQLQMVGKRFQYCARDPVNHLLPPLDQYDSLFFLLCCKADGGHCRQHNRKILAYQVLPEQSRIR